MIEGFDLGMIIDMKKKRRAQIDSKDTRNNAALRDQVSDLKEQVGSYIECKPVLTSWRDRVHRFNRLNFAQTAAAASFYFLFSLFPLLLLFFSLLNMINPDLAVRVEAALPSLEIAIPPQVLSLLLDFIEGTKERSGVPFISITALGLLWSASKGVGSIVNAMSRIYNSKRKFNFILKRLLGIVAILALSLILIAILLVLSFNRVVLSYLSDFIQLPEILTIPNFNLTAYFIAFTALTVIFTIVFAVLGRRRGFFAHTLFSAAMTSIAWLLISFAMSAFLSRRPDYYVTYGAMTGIIFLMLWLFAAIYLIMAGAFLHTELIRKYPRIKKIRRRSRKTAADIK